MFTLYQDNIAVYMTNGNGPRQLHMWFERDPRLNLEYSLCDRPWVKVDNPMKHMSDQNVKICPTILLLTKNGVHSPMVHHISRRNTFL